MSKSFSKKNSKTFFLLVLWCFALLGTQLCVAQKQTKKELENKKLQIQKEIEKTNQLLAETKKNKKHSLNELLMLNKKISVEEIVSKQKVNTNIFVLKKVIQLKTT